MAYSSIAHMSLVTLATFGTVLGTNNTGLMLFIEVEGSHKSVRFHAGVDANELATLAHTFVNVNY